MHFDTIAFAKLQATASGKSVALNHASGLMTLSGQVTTLEQIQAIRDVCNLVTGFLTPGGALPDPDALDERHEHYDEDEEPDNEDLESDVDNPAAEEATAEVVADEEYGNEDVAMEEATAEVVADEAADEAAAEASTDESGVGDY